MVISVTMHCLFMLKAMRRFQIGTETENQAEIMSLKGQLGTVKEQVQKLNDAWVSNEDSEEKGVKMDGPNQAPRNSEEEENYAENSGPKPQQGDSEGVEVVGKMNPAKEDVGLGDQEKVENKESTPDQSKEKEAADKPPEAADDKLDSDSSIGPNNEKSQEMKEESTEEQDNDDNTVGSMVDESQPPTITDNEQQPLVDPEDERAVGETSQIALTKGDADQEQEEENIIEDSVEENDPQREMASLVAAIGDDRTRLDSVSSGSQEMTTLVNEMQSLERKFKAIQDKVWGRPSTSMSERKVDVALVEPPNAVVDKASGEEEQEAEESEGEEEDVVVVEEDPNEKMTLSEMVAAIADARTKLDSIQSGSPEMASLVEEMTGLERRYKAVETERNARDPYWRSQQG